MGFLAACKAYFGTRSGQSAVDFAREVRELTPADRAEMAPLLSVLLNCTVTA
jgi:hypothetical protein